jgi:large subunit ribosomal protein L25
MENIMSVNAESRKEVGKQIAKRLRREGKIPAIIYGENIESIPISLTLSDIKNILKSEMGENTILRIHRDDMQVDAMLKEVQYDYLSTNIIHADFIRIDLNKTIDVNVPILLTGEPIGVRVEDGILDFVRREVELRCMPTKIPEKIEVDVSELHIGHSLKIGSLEIDKDLELISDPNLVVCAVSVKGAAEVEEVEEEELEEGVEGEEGETTEGEEGTEKKEEEKKQDK